MSQTAKPNIQQAATLHQSGKLADAEKLYLAILEDNPRHFDACHLLGVVMMQRGDGEGGAEQIRRALEIVPNNAPALSNLGNALSDLGRYQEALDSYDKALVVQPNFSNALINRGNALKDLKRYDEALAAFEKAQALDPNRPDLYLNRGTVLKLMKRYDEALAAFDKAIAMRPSFADAHNNRANALKELGRQQEALESFDRAVAAGPQMTSAHVNRGNLLKDMGRLKDAMESYARAIPLNNGKTLVDGLHLHLKMLLSDWQGYETLTRALQNKVRAGATATTPFSFLALPSTAPEQLQAAQRYVGAFHPPQPAIWKGEKYDHKKIRIAYLSADYHDHATTHLMAGLFDHHDHDAFELTAISFGRADDSASRQRLVKAFDHFIDVNHLSDIQVAQLLREREIDIAVDLKGFTQEARCDILAYRPAPIQVNYLGYPGTMAAPYIDYIVADPVVIPPDHQPFYGEKIVWLPHSYQVNDRTRVIAEQTPTRADCGLPDNGFVFCCFNNNYKITPDVFEIWMRLLQAVPGSVLWLYEKHPDATQNLQREAEKRGVSADRLIFARKKSLSHHLARHRLADLFLDTLPYNAHTTASDALWAGLPVLTCRGDTFASRVAASLLMAANMPELITTSLAEYEARALELARDREKLTAIKNKLQGQLLTCPLFDTALFTNHIEAAYKTMWQRYQDGLSPASFSVSR